MVHIYIYMIHMLLLVAGTDLCIEREDSLNRDVDTLKSVLFEHDLVWGSGRGLRIEG